MEGLNVVLYLKIDRVWDPCVAHELCLIVDCAVVIYNMVLEEEIASPVELAKAYMGSRPSKVALRQDLVLHNNATGFLKSPNTLIAPKIENGFTTPRSQESFLLILLKSILDINKHLSKSGIRAMVARLQEVDSTLIRKIKRHQGYAGNGRVSVETRQQNKKEETLDVYEKSVEQEKYSAKNQKLRKFCFGVVTKAWYQEFVCRKVLRISKETEIKNNTQGEKQRDSVVYREKKGRKNTLAKEYGEELCGTAGTRHKGRKRKKAKKRSGRRDPQGKQDDAEIDESQNEEMNKTKFGKDQETPRIVGDDSARSEPTEVADSNNFKPLLKEKRLKEQTHKGKKINVDTNALVGENIIGDYWNATTKGKRKLLTFTREAWNKSTKALKKILVCLLLTRRWNKKGYTSLDRERVGKAL
ncbi:hypothetical protein Tco_1125013 [Tanacetum coccineum]|uniref:Uncharacterized protein n=1 Tax=Tanacetum coccineum TaxID=301880 RepID=A0ABQ5JAS9_9ASTR